MNMIFELLFERNIIEKFIITCLFGMALILIQFYVFHWNLLTSFVISLGINSIIFFLYINIF